MKGNNQLQIKDLLYAVSQGWGIIHYQLGVVTLKIYELAKKPWERKFTAIFISMNFFSSYSFLIVQIWDWEIHKTIFVAVSCNMWKVEMLKSCSVEKLKCWKVEKLKYWKVEMLKS